MLPLKNGARNAFRRLNGYWAVAIWDNLTKELVVGRDRLGEKPLLYTQVDGDWIFASEIEGATQAPENPCTAQPAMLMHFIATGAAPAGEETFFSGIKSVEPGTFLTFRERNRLEDQILEPCYDVTSPDELTLRVAVQELDELLTDAVRLRLRGDIRVGAMLSGGLDSTSVISVSRRCFRPDRTKVAWWGIGCRHSPPASPRLRMTRPRTRPTRWRNLCRLIEINVSQNLPGRAR